MKNHILTLIALLGIATFLIGCGGGDDDTSSNSSNHAPSSLNGQIYSVTDPNGTGSLHFTSASAFELTEPGTTTIQTGTYTSTLTGNTYTVQVSLVGGKTGTLTLSFDSSAQGHFSLALTGEPVASGTFAVASGSNQGTTTGSTAGTTSGTTAGTTSGSTSGTTAGTTSGTTSSGSGGPFAGKSITFSVQSGLTEGSSYTVIFSGSSGQGTFRTSVASHTGNYIYGDQSGIGELTLFYDQSSNGSSTHDNDYLQLHLENQTFEGMRLIGNDSGRVTGTFTLQ